jgi:formyltetrahydrofolate synthetase
VRSAALSAGAAAAVVTRHHALGGAGAFELAQALIAVCEAPRPDFKFLYQLDLPIKVCA